ncbi:MAG: hypothetical protein QOF51_3893, partial [Chloroflexota bacterium]|nr:hypothetical protein [Chloroflexota bacterium]
SIKQVLRGEVLLEAGLVVMLIQRLAHEYGVLLPAPFTRLTPRENEVLDLIAQGLTNKEIASELFVSVGTVKIHVEHAIAKLGVSGRTQAVVRCMQLGLLTPTFA